jgi:hypothetical protein
VNQEETKFRVHVLTTPATISRLILQKPVDYLLCAARRGEQWYLSRDGKTFAPCPEEIVPELDIALDAYHQMDWNDSENAEEADQGFWIYHEEMGEKVPEAIDKYLVKRSLTMEEPTVVIKDQIEVEPQQP